MALHLGRWLGIETGGRVEVWLRMQAAHEHGVGLAGFHLVDGLHKLGCAANLVGPCHGAASSATLWVSSMMVDSNVYFASVLGTVIE